MMRHSRFILFFLLLGRMLSAQTDLTLYQLTNVPGSNLLNPGFRQRHIRPLGFLVCLPSDFSCTILDSS